VSWEVDPEKGGEERMGAWMDACGSEMAGLRRLLGHLPVLEGVLLDLEIGCSIASSCSS
jgi:hypothetical protein